MNEYTYTISTQTSNGKVSIPRLSEAITSNATISTPMYSANNFSISGDTLTIRFDSALSGAEQTELDSVVSGHDGTKVSATKRKLYAESDGEMQTTSTTLKNKVQLTDTVEEGDYIVRWYAELGNNYKIGSVVNVKVDVDGTTVAEVGEQVSSKHGYMPFSGFKKVSLAYGSRTVNMSFSSESSIKAVRVRRARLFLEKL